MARLASIPDKIIHVAESKSQEFECVAHEELKLAEECSYFKEIRDLLASEMESVNIKSQVARIQKNIVEHKLQHTFLNKK